MARAIDPAVESAIREALADPTASYGEVAEKAGCCNETIRRYAIRWGLERDKRFTITDDQRAKIHRMLQAGCWTNRQIAKGVGCAVGTVQDIATSLGLDRMDRSLVGSSWKVKAP